MWHIESSVGVHSFFFLFFLFLELHPQYMEVPTLGIQSELQLSGYTTATAMPDSSQLYLQPTPQLTAMPDS